VIRRTQWPGPAPGRGPLRDVEVQDALRSMRQVAENALEPDASALDATDVPIVVEVSEQDQVLLFNSETGTTELVTVEDFMGALQTVMETCERMLSQMNSRLYSFQTSIGTGPALRVDGSGATQPVSGTISTNLVVNTLPASATQQLLANEVRRQIVTS